MECPLVVHCWADLQSVHGLRCYDNIMPNAKCQRVLVLALCLGCTGELILSNMFTAHVHTLEQCIKQCTSLQ